MEHAGARVHAYTRRFIYILSLSPVGSSSHEDGGAGEAGHARGNDY